MHCKDRTNFLLHDGFSVFDIFLSALSPLTTLPAITRKSLVGKSVIKQCIQQNYFLYGACIADRILWRLTTWSLTTLCIQIFQ